MTKPTLTINQKQYDFFELEIKLSTPSTTDILFRTDNQEHIQEISGYDGRLLNVTVSGIEGVLAQSMTVSGAFKIHILNTITGVFWLTSSTETGFLFHIFGGKQ